MPREKGVNYSWSPVGSWPREVVGQGRAWVYVGMVVSVNACAGVTVKEEERVVCAGLEPWVSAGGCVPAW